MQDQMKAEAKRIGMTLAKSRILNDPSLDRTEQFLDQITYDAAFRGDQNRTDYGSIDGELSLVPYSLSNTDRFTDDDAPPPEDYIFNLFRRAVRMFTALFGVREPTTRSTAVNSRNPEHVRRARLANRINLSLDVALEPRDMQSRLSYLLGKSGTVYAYTRWVASKDFGVTQVPLTEPQEVQLAPPSYECPMCGGAGFQDQLPSQEYPYCPGCGSALMEEDFDEGLSDIFEVPTGETVDVPNGSLVSTLHTQTAVLTPDGYSDLVDCPWLGLVEEIDIGQLSSIYGIPVSEVQGGAASTADEFTGAHARAVTTSYLGRQMTHPRQHKAHRGIYWLQPSNYAFITDEGERTLLQQHYPDGLKLTVVAGKPVRCENESLTDVWAVCVPEENETMRARPYMVDSIGISDIFNDMMSISVEAAESSIPMNIFDPAVLSSEDIRRHGRKHATFVPSKQQGRDLSHTVQSFRPAEFHPEMVNLGQALFNKHDEIQGTLPIIWGSVAGAETAYESNAAKNQALAMLAIPWAKMRGFHETIRRQAILQFASHSTGVLWLNKARFPEPSNMVEIASIEELEEIKLGGWKIESDEQMPVSAAQIRDDLLKMLNGGVPEPVLQALGFLHPTNLPLLHSYLSHPGFVSPILQEVEAVNALMQRLLMGQPMQGPDGQPMPSEQLDEFLYPPSLVVEIMKPFLVSDEGVNERERNEMGWMNVRAFTQMAMQMLQQQQMQQMQQQGPPPEGEQGPPPQDQGAPVQQPAV